jgi:hypothetical protein
MEREVLEKGESITIVFCFVRDDFQSAWID